MFKVYWTELFNNQELPQSMNFAESEMKDALQFMELLRGMDNTCNFVTLCSENPNSVGKPGVAETNIAYSWTKRRNNERNYNET